MKKLLLLLLVLTLAVPAFAQKKDIHREYYPSGKLRLEAEVLKGVQHGLTRVYFENGRLAAEANYQNGKQDGINTDYYRDGKIMMIRTYKKGKQEGLQLNFGSEYGSICNSYVWKNGKVVTGYARSGRVYSRAELDRVYTEDEIISCD